MTQFNTYKTKRDAHKISRRGTEFWNPFRHIAWDGRRPPGGPDEQHRTSTWPVDLEGQQGRNVRETTTEMQHALTAPELSQSSENGGADPAVTGGLGDPEKDPVNGGSSQKESGDTVVDSQKLADEPFATGASNSVADPSGGSIVKQRSRPSSKEPDVIQDAAVGAEEDKKSERKKTGFFVDVKPSKPFTVANQIQRTLLNSWINLLLVAAPVGIGLNFLPGRSGIMVFFVNFIAIVPLAAMLSFATEEIALRVGEVLGGLLNATFGNAVELIVAVLALRDNQVLIVQTSLIGSILSNLLLVLGMCFLCGGWNRPEQHFNTVVAQTAASLLALAVSGIIIPTIFDINSNTPVSDVAMLSRGTSIILLVVYGGYLFFQLKTHHSVFSAESQKVPARHEVKELKKGKISQGLAGGARMIAHGLPDKSENERLAQMLRDPLGEEDDHEDPQLHFFVAIGALVISTIIIAFCAEYMVEGIHDLTADGKVSEEFVGLILLPIVGNAAEHATAVTVAIKDKMDLAIGVAVGSSMQVALFLIPLLVVVGWGMGNDAMSLSFDVFQVAVLFVSVLLTNYLIGDGKSHWLEGMLLVCLYLIIAVCSWWYPASGPVT